MSTEHPILFSGPMVRAIIAGKKTQTRRVLAWPKHVGGHAVDRVVSAPHYGHGMKGEFVPLNDIGGIATRPFCAHSFRCPYGSPGDTLWVRETWAVPPGSTLQRECAYRADNNHGEDATWTPSIYMRRWASRLSLRVTDVRVERLQEISEEDARAEGVERGVCTHPDCSPGSCASSSYVASFARLWDTINGKRAPWSSNPWVWVIGFARLAELDADNVRGDVTHGSK